MVIEPAPFVIVILLPAVNVVRVNPVPLPISKAPFAGVEVRPVPPCATSMVVAFHVPVATFPTLDVVAVKFENVPFEAVVAPMVTLSIPPPVMLTFAKEFVPLAIPLTAE
jgi:hypothetical protein